MQLEFGKVEKKVQLKNEKVRNFVQPELRFFYCDRLNHLCGRYRLGSEEFLYVSVDNTVPKELI